MADSEFVLTLQGEKELIKRIDALPQKIKERVGVKALNESGRLLANHIQSKLRRGGVLNVRSNRLRRSIGYVVERAGDNLQARVGTNVVYARIHEFGGTITARRAMFLTIPLRAALQPAGVVRFSARNVIKNPLAFGYDATFFSDGVLFGVRGAKTRSTSIPLFALKRSVRIPARPYMRPALAEKRDEIIQTISDEVGKAVAEP